MLAHCMDLDKQPAISKKKQQPDGGEKQTIRFRFHYFVREVADWAWFSRVRSHL